MGRKDKNGRHSSASEKMTHLSLVLYASVKIFSEKKKRNENEITLDLLFLKLLSVCMKIVTGSQIISEYICL